jgi:cellulose synthase/poly-beta-1,6-N-acetylglucosamine synthase-like glycosyltransferase
MEVIGLFVIGYFAVLNSIYLVFTAIAWRGLSRHLRERPYSGEAEAFSSPFTPGISIILPAYNEEAGIVESARSLLRLRYPVFEIVVVNDGSGDGMMDRLREEFDLVPIRKAMRGGLECKPIREVLVSRRYPEITVVDKENGGKADALNAGTLVASHPFLCACDADAMLEEDALLRVAKPLLDDPSIVAATGGIVRIANGCRIEAGQVVQVGLPRSSVATFQVVEYFRAFLVGRMGWSRLRSLLIISGAFGLFRRDVVEEVGGWWHDTVGEDMELVLRLHRHLRERDEEYRITFVPDPVCWTEAPETLKVLGRQRRRWQRGLFEGLWRHRRLMGNPRYGAVGVAAFPYFLLFELLGPVIELTGYILIPVAVWLDVLSIGFLFAFTLMAVLLGILLSVSALALEEVSFRRHPSTREMTKMLLFSVLENFGYRQILAFWRVQAFVDLARGQKSWGQMQRKGLGAGARKE